MALNFPSPSFVGEVYQDPTSGNTYVCTSLGPPAQWVGSGSSTSLDSTYLRTDASNDPVTGNLILEPTTNVNPLLVKQPSGNTTPALRIENSGTGNSIEVGGVFSVSSSGILSTPTGTVTTPAISPVSDGNTGIYFPASDTIALSTNGVEVARVTSQGIVNYYNKSNILGTVSQSGGVPTGAIIQRGSNVNGEFIRYVDGTQLCTRGIQFAGNVKSYTWTFPAAFFVPAGSISPSRRQANRSISVIFSGGGLVYGDSSDGATSFTNTRIDTYRSATTQNADAGTSVSISWTTVDDSTYDSTRFADFRITAIGRWY